MTHLGDLLSAHIDGEVTADERSRIDAHLGSCAMCTQELADITAARLAVRGLPMVEPRVAIRPARRLVRPSLAWAASGAAAAALALGLAIAPGDEGPTIDLDTLRDQHTARVVVDPGISTVRGGVGDP
ncbi:MAG TPA: zf-HC2 domain-containing protein [Acidimicrobiia bacterium]|nr:zf-HC2 domain-containing protein [Acidimicrobiia bacterium]